MSWRIKASTAIECAFDCAAGLAEDEASLRASSLAFSVLFCAAPLGAMLLGLAGMFPKAFGFLPAIYAKISPHLFPGALSAASDALASFSINAENLSAYSLAFSLASLILLSMQLEKCLQECWGLAPAASPMPAIARHWMALTLTPCAMAILSWAAYQAIGFSDSPFSGAAAGFALLSVFFMALTWGLPSGRPAAKTALAASCLAAAECLAIQNGFSLAWSRIQSYGLIYGTAAAFVGAILWIWLFWLSLLSSVSIVSTIALGRRRDWEAAGIGWLAKAMGVQRSDSDPGPSREKGRIEQAMDELAASGTLFPPHLYESRLGPDSESEAKRKAFASCCAMMAIEQALAAHPELLAKPKTGDMIAQSPPREPKLNEEGEEGRNQTSEGPDEREAKQDAGCQ